MDKKNFSFLNFNNILRTFCIEFAQKIVFGFGYVIPACSIIFGFSNKVQSQPFGVVILGLFLFALLWSLFFLVKKYDALRPKIIRIEEVVVLRKVMLGFVLLAPIVASRIENESFYGAIESVAYWQSQLDMNAKEDCSFYSYRLQDAIDEFNVTEKKYNMGIATLKEYKESINSLREAENSNKLMQSFKKSCIDDKQSRNKIIIERLVDLTNNNH